MNDSVVVVDSNLRPGRGRIRISDNSVRRLGGAGGGIDNTINVLLPIFAGDGISDEIVAIKGYATEAAIATFGEDVFDYDKYGINAIYFQELLKAGATVITQRLVDNDSVAAGLVFAMGIKTVTRQLDPSDPQSATENVLSYKRMLIAYDTLHHDIDEPYVETLSDPNLTIYPIMRFSAPAVGKNGNRYAIRIKPDPTRDAARSDGRRYSMSVAYLDRGKFSEITIEDIMFSLSRDAKIQDGLDYSEYIETSYADELPSSGQENKYNLVPRLEKVYNLSYQKLLERVKDELVDVDFADADLDKIIDPIFFLNRYGEKLPSDLYMEDADSVDITTYHQFCNGSDGDLDLASSTLDSKRENILKKFYSGEWNTFLTSGLNCPFDIAVDTYWSRIVSESFEDLKKILPYRFILRAVEFVDAKSYDTALKVVDGERVTEKSFVSRVFDSRIYRYKSRDIKVSGTLYWITDYVRRFNDYGKRMHVNAGITHGQTENNSTRLPNPKQYDILDEKRYIYPYSIGMSGPQSNPVVAWMSDRTQYKEASQLGSTHHAFIVSRCITITHLVSAKYTFQSGNRNDEMIDEINREFGRFLPDDVDVDTTVYRTKKDRLGKSATIGMSFQFPDMIYAFNIEVTINNSEE